ncbi:toxin glutamine deamidase domain-containing protein [Saccharopolyspora flava]|uniref:Papain fold toxin 1, glutamine deamidase n=1 Tax=Saccharopolyspora flava TaxID=95161 RepID=A0A1I6TVB2_9PSEU|nr:toxin glutamine deamidase domain-containing protein [Saccharopolyspora flava]SFS93126.1 Papain fold toxin 1, glutamine deamidase [Saccharopolyspora flava]
MGLEIPDEVKWLLPIVVGESWPEGDEDKLRELSEAWKQAAQALPGAMDAGNAAAREVLASWEGEAAQKFDETWKKFTSGDGAVFSSLEESCNGLAEACDKTALDIEYTKYMIIASLIMLAIQIAAMIAAAFVSFGASTAGVVPAQLATRAAVQMIFRQLVQKLAQQGVKKVVREALEKVLKEGLQKLISKQALGNLGKTVAMNVGSEVALDAGIQGLQMAKGDRDSWDFGKTKDSAVGGVAGGIAGHLVSGKAVSGAAGEAASSSVLGHAARGASEGALGSVGEAAMTGQLGDLSASDVLMGASSGAVDGGTGGAKDGFSEAAGARSAAESASTVADSAGSAAETASSPETSAAPPADSGASLSPADSGAGTTDSGSSGAAEHSSGGGEAVSSGSDSVGSGGVSTSEGSSSTSESNEPAATTASGAVTAERPETAGATTGSAGVGSAMPGAAAQHSSGQATPQPGQQPGSFGMQAPPQGPGPGQPPMGAGPRAAGFGPTGMPAQQPSFHPNQQQGYAQQGPPQQGNFAQRGQLPPQAVAPGPQHTGPAQHSAPPQHPQYGQPNGTGQPVARPENPRPTQQQGFQQAPAHQPPLYGPPQNPAPNHGAPQPGPRGPMPPPAPQQGPPRQAGPPRQGPPQAFAQPPHQGRQQFSAPPADPRSRGPQPPQPPNSAPPQGRPAAPGPMPPHQGAMRGSLSPQSGPVADPRPSSQPTREARPETPPEQPAQQDAPESDLAENTGELPENTGRESDTTAPHDDKADSSEERSTEERDTEETRTTPEDSQHADEDQNDDSNEPAELSTPADTYDGGPFDWSDLNEQHGARPERLSPLAKDQSLDFCLDPNYRAPKESVDAHEASLSAGRMEDGSDRTRRAAMAQVVNERFAANPELRSVSKSGALAVHSYTAHDVFGPLNAATRFGTMSETQRHQLRAIVSGMNEQPRFEGRAVRGMSLGDVRAAELAAAHYVPGEVTVEPSITSMSMDTDTKSGSDYVSDFELQVDSKTARILQGLASQVGEREAALMPMSQLYVHSKELVTYFDKHNNELQKWVIKAEEIVPGDPRYLSQEEASSRVTERQRRSFGEELMVGALRGDHIDRALSGESTTDSTTSGGADAGRSTTDGEKRSDETQSTKDADKPSIRSMLDGEDTPEPGVQTHDGEVLPQPGDAQHLQPGDDQVPPLPTKDDGTPDWEVLSNATPPVTTLPAIHSGTAQVQHGMSYVAANHPELPKVNPNFYTPEAWDRGWQTNCSKCVVNYAKRLLGIDEPVESVLPDDLPKEDRIGWMAGELNSQWEPHRSYDSVIHRMSQQPVGSHASVYVSYEIPPATPDGDPVTAAHVAIVTNTPDGVAFIDPQSGHLMNLPYPPKMLSLLPFGSENPETPGTSDTSAAAADNLTPVQAKPDRSEEPEAEARAEEEPPLSADDTTAEPQRGVEPDEDESDSNTEEDSDSPAAERSWRQDGPWLGQHVNPLRTVPEQEDDFAPGPFADERIVPTVEPTDPSHPGTQPSGSMPDAPGTAGSGAGSASGPGGAGAGSFPPGASAFNRSMTGELNLGDLAAGPPPVDSSRTGSIPSMNASTGADAQSSIDGPASTGSTGGSSGQQPTTPAGGAAPGAPSGMAPGGSSGTGGTESAPAAGGNQPGLASGGSSAPVGGAGFPAQGKGGAASSNHEGRSHEVGSVTHNREIAIPRDVAALYLGNHEPTTLLPDDGRQVFFRKDAVVDLGGGALDELPGSALRLRYEASDPSGVGIPFDADEMRDDEFVGRAEIYTDGSDGSELVLGTFEGGAWNPTPEGTRWLNGTQERNDGSGRTR